MQILWARGKAFVRDIMDDLPAPQPPVTTVSSIVRKLEAEGLVGHESFGKTYRYFPVLEKENYGRSVATELLNDYFGGSPRQLLSFFLENDNADPAEIERLLAELKKKN